MKYLEIDVSVLRNLFDYYPDTGRLIWKFRPLNHFSRESSWKRWNTRYAGKEAGTVQSKGYISVILTINGKEKAFKAHRIIWALVTGDWPSDQIDHVNVNAADNRLVNLREATHAENQQNSNVFNTNKLGVKGVHQNPAGKYIAAISSKYIGIFDTVEDAAKAYDSEVLILFGEFARTNDTKMTKPV